MSKPRPPHWSNILQNLDLITPQEAYHYRKGKSPLLQTVQDWSRAGVRVVVMDGVVRMTSKGVEAPAPVPKASLTPAERKERLEAAMLAAEARRA